MSSNNENNKPNLKVVDLSEIKDRDKKEYETAFIKQLEETLDDLKKSAQEGRLKQLVLQYDQKVNPNDLPKDIDPEVFQQAVEVSYTSVLHWNEEEDADKDLGYAEKLKQRIFLVNEGLIRPGE